MGRRDDRFDSYILDMETFNVIRKNNDTFVSVNDMLTYFYSILESTKDEKLRRVLVALIQDFQDLK